MVDSTAYFSRCKALNVIGRTEAEKTAEQLIAASVYHFTDGDDCAQYTLNDAYQSLTQAGLRDWRNKEQWEARMEFISFAEQKAIDIVSRHVKSVFSRTVGIVDAERVGLDQTYVVRQERVLIHVWQSRREARRYHEALLRLSQAKFDFVIGCPIHVPLDALVAFQGVLLSVTWMPPLVSTNPTHLKNAPLTAHLVERLKASLLIPVQDEVQLYLGADCRYYCASVSSVMCHTLVFKDGIDSSSEVRYEWLEKLVGSLPNHWHLS